MTTKVFKAHATTQTCATGPGGCFPLLIPQKRDTMALETANFIHQLDPANPSGPDRIANGDDHIRMIKAALQGTFPNIDGAVTLTHTFLNSLAGLVVPFGAIQLWYGSAVSIPAGYAICDGTEVAKSDGTGNVTTPDMRGRVPVGASAAHLTGTTFGQDSKTVTSEVGGAHSHVGATALGGTHTHGVTVAGTALTIAQMPAHTHTLATIGGGSEGPTPESGVGGTGYTATTSSTGSGATHTHTATVDTTGSGHAHDLEIEAVPAHSHSVTVDVVQASIALHYIMKV